MAQGSIDQSTAEHGAATVGSWLRRLPPVLALMALAPWAAECSWGGFGLAGFLPVVIVLAPMYGGAAVLIRETGRRLGGGWPTLVLLAAAFGLAQAGLVDQSLFNRDFLDDTEFASLAGGAEATWVPVIGVSAQQVVTYVGNHIALSICAPIANVESYLSPGRSQRPWLPSVPAMRTSSCCRLPSRAA